MRFNKSDVKPGLMLTGGEYPGEVVTSARNAWRKSIAKGDLMTAASGGSVQIKSRAALPLDDAITRMTKARTMAAELAAALKARH